MSSIWKLIILATTISTVILGQKLGEGDVDTAIEDVFGPGPQGPNPPAQKGQSIDELISGVFPGPDGSNQNAGGGGLGPEQSIHPGQPDACECVPYYLCDNGTIKTDGSGVLDIRQGTECPNYFEVCCKAPRSPENPITPPPKVQEDKGHHVCGTRNPDGVGFRITGNLDNEAQYGEFPWMVAILREELLIEGTEETKLNVYQCGGALIHPQVVMTGAHCVVGRDPAILKIRVGEWDTQTKNELFPHQDRRIAQVIPHEKYYAGALYNDIALLVLKEPVEYADNVDIVCLPKQDDVVIHKSCFASGWGKDKFGKEGNYQVILKKLELPIVPRPQCQEALRRTRLGAHFRLHDSFICAGGEEGKDTCKGDGGGPLVCPIPGKQYQYQQVGMVAWGIGCGQSLVPGVYVNVAKFRSWIDHQMTKLKFHQDYTY